MDDPSTRRGSNTGIWVRSIYVIMGMYVVITEIFIQVIKMECLQIADMAQQDDSVIQVYNVVSNMDVYIADLYLCLYMAWVILIMGMILYKLCTAIHKIQLMEGRHAEVVRVLVAAYMAGLVAMCLIVPFTIGWTQSILTVALGAMIVYNVLLCRRRSERLSPIEKGQAITGATICTVALMEVVFHVCQITGLEYVMLIIYLILVLATAILTTPVKNGDTCKQSGDRRV